VHTIGGSQHNQYGIFSGWDSYHSLSQLQAMLDPKAASDQAQSLLNYYAQDGILQQFGYLHLNNYVNDGDPAQAIIADYYVVRGDKEGFSRARDIDFNWAAISAVVLGIIVGWWVNKAYPTFLFGAAGIATSFVVYVLLAKASPAALGAGVSARASGAEAEPT